MQKAPRYDKLRRLLVEGSSQGIHLGIFTAGLRTLGQVLNERSDLPLFNHRVATQISEDESFNLFRNRKGAQLQSEGAPLAIYANMQLNLLERFKPYGMLTTPEEWQYLGKEVVRDIARVTS